MNIYLVTRTDVETRIFGAYDSFVCCSESEEDAKLMSPTGDIMNDAEKGRFDKDRDEWVKTTESLIVNKIGVAEVNQVRGVVLASYNDY